MKPLMYDICRCHGTDCDEKFTCARYRTIKWDEQITVPALISHTSNLCTTDNKPFKIEVKHETIHPSL